MLIRIRLLEGVLSLELSPRNCEILRTVVHSYIKKAYPVGSRTLTKDFDLGLSPASIRNIMADLEEMGYLVQPHTSAGRIPTEKGYKFYVDGLLKENQWEAGDPNLEEVYQRLRIEDVRELLHETSRFLSVFSHYTGLVLCPNFSRMILNQIRFIPIRKRHIMAIYISDDGMLYNRIIETDDDLSWSELDKIALYLNSRFSGMSLQDIKNRLMSEIEEDKKLYNRLMLRAVQLARESMDIPGEGEVYLEGASNILDTPEFAIAEKMKMIFKAFDEKYNMVQILERFIDSAGVKVSIGSDNSFLGIEDCSLVVSTYKRGNQTLGILGIIGPTRMEYSKVIPVVDYTAKMLSKYLEEI